MKRLFLVVLAVLVFGFTACLVFIPGVRAQIFDLFNGDPDMPDFARFKVNKEEFMKRRAGDIALLRGHEEGKRLDPQLRVDAILQMIDQERRLSDAGLAPAAPWLEIGPNPIPNGQTTTVSTAVSGRVTAVDVHPTDPNTAYVGTAQGGVYRTLDGGATWTQLMNSAVSLAIGAVTINPLDPTIVFVGTGESNLSLDSFAGVGLYRINNANTSPVVNGPFETRIAGTGTGVSNGHAFLGTSITRIAVDPLDANRVYVGNTIGVGGISGTQIPTGGSNGFIGLYFSNNALSATPTFSRVGTIGAGDVAVTDIVFEPGVSANLIVGAMDLGAAPDDTGVYRTVLATNAPAAAPVFTRTLTYAQGDSRLAINKIAGTTTVLVARSNFSGILQRSVNGGVTWPTTLTDVNGFCGGQCFYDIAVAIDPTNSNNIYLGGSANGIDSFVMERSTNAGVSFTKIDTGLHADMHAIAIAPSNAAIAYVGNDGGVWQSTNVNTALPANVAWTSRNNSTFSATQFMGLAVHPTDPNFTIGGTQDNGTNCLGPCGSLPGTGWRRADFGDGGYAVIDQNAVDTTNVTMYHTYFNQTNAMGYSRVTNTADAEDNEWTLYGCGFGGIANGMTCTASAIRFYAPMEQGPGNPNTLYFGSDVLYRSANAGATMVKVSQEPITPGGGVAISAIGIAPLNDNVRIVGLANGGVFGTGTTPGTTTLQNLDPVGAGSVIPDAFVSRTVIDPSNSNTAYVTLSAFGVANVWKTTTLSSFADGLAPTWTAATGTGANVLPQVPVSGFVIDTLNPNILYAGTDIGVYVSPNGGTNWFPFGTGLPRIAVFDIAITNAEPRQVRIATHGRGLWQVPALAPTAANVSVAGRVLSPGGSQVPRATVVLTDQSGNSRSVTTNSFGYFRFEEVASGQTYVVSVSSKRYQFEPIVVAVNDQIDDLTITGSDGFGK